MTSTGSRPPASGCPVSSEQLLLQIYDESTPDVARRIESHLADCAPCRAEFASLRETLDTVDRAELASMAEAMAHRDTPGAWNNIASRLRPDGAVFAESPRRPTPYWLQAAAVLLIAGASFLAGATWMSPGNKANQRYPKQADRAGGSPAPQPAMDAREARDPAAALREFTTRTHGYLNRSRIVLLEIANADTGSDSSMLREATRSLLDETRDARQIAGQIPDSKLDDLLGSLESILIELSELSDWGDEATVKRIRDQVNESGLLEQIEILTPPPTHLAHKRIGR